MKKCTCGASKWKTFPGISRIQCLRCYKVYSRPQLKGLKDAKGG